MADERTSGQGKAPSQTEAAPAVRVYEYLVPAEAGRQVLPVLPVPTVAALGVPVWRPPVAVPAQRPAFAILVPRRRMIGSPALRWRR